VPTGSVPSERYCQVLSPRHLGDVLRSVCTADIFDRKISEARRQRPAVLVAVSIALASSGRRTGSAFRTGAPARERGKRRFARN
jgi:hypothetical protein